MPEGMTDEQAVEALTKAFEQDAESGTPIFEAPVEGDQRITVANQVNKPEPAVEQSAPEGSAPATPAATQEPVTPAVQDSTPEFMDRADLNSLLEGVEDPGARESIERAYKSFQAGFTQARQRESEIVKQYQQLGDPQSLQQAVYLQTVLQNPDNLVQLYSELGEALSASGLVTFDDGPPDMPQQPTPVQSGIPSLDALDDPELEPFKQAFGDMRSELEQIKSERASERQAMEEARLRDAVVGELQRQENILRQQHPDWTDADFDAVYELGSFYDGNLFSAATRYDAINNDRLQRYLAGKQSAVEATSPVPRIPNAPTGDSSSEGIHTLADGHKAAMEALRHIEAAE